MAGQRNSYGKRSHSQSDYADNGRNKRRNTGSDKDLFSIGPDDTVYRYLCAGKKIGSIIGRGGEIVKQLRVDTKSKIRIGETVPDCEERVVTIYSASEETNNFDGSENCICPAQDALFKVHEKIVSETIDEDSENAPQISGEATVVKKALYEIATRLHKNPSRSQNLLASAAPNIYSSSSLVGHTAGAPIVGMASLMGSYRGYKGESGDLSRSFYSAPRNESSSKEFSICLLCPTANIGGVIGKGGVIINQIRQESGAAIKVDSFAAEGDDCVISISVKEFFEDTYSPTVEAALRLQPRCSEKVDKDSGLTPLTTRLLVPTSRIGCLIGKGGTIINEMRKITKANIRILSKEGLPKVAAEDDEMVQISGELDVVKDALIQVTSRLRANLFEREGAASAFVPVLPYLPMTTGSDTLKHESRDSRRHGHSYSAGYGGTTDLPRADGYGSYSGIQQSSSIGYGAYEGYSLGRSGGSRSSGQDPASRRKSYGY
ncbi:KH domain-containing protein At4g18375-like isoform X3 [Solanum tuberosum]|uniref:KH domain-containing protein At4g18375-like isoform X3 n=1 Tax=Solanum tuberosum TaxID=4113 RepID=UPI0003D25B0C|nr:PREDICTED: KH domain-containing protein At4g18375-like isoform X3 [Solanum tuberosum]